MIRAGVLFTVHSGGAAPWTIAGGLGHLRRESCGFVSAPHIRCRPRDVRVRHRAPPSLPPVGGHWYVSRRSPEILADIARWMPETRRVDETEHGRRRVDGVAFGPVRRGCVLEGGRYVRVDGVRGLEGVSQR